MDNQFRNNEFDAIVVGSGPGGATVARELSKRRQRVLILERGGDSPLKEGLRSAISILNAVPVSDKLANVRALTTGGTTALYFAVADYPPLETFRRLGVDISRELEEAKREVPLAVLPDELMGVQAMRVRESALQLGHAWKKNIMMVDLAKCPSGYTYASKWNARSYLEEAVQHGATLITRAAVGRVLIEKGRAIGVEYTLRKGKKDFEVRQAFGAKTVLAAGGAASPLILRDSGMRSIEDRGFYCHPGLAVFGIVSGMKAGENFIGSMGVVADEYISLSDANCGRALFRMIMLGQRRFIRAFCHSRSIGVGVMVKEGLGGGLKSDGRFYKQLSKEDLGRLKKGEEMARQIVRNAGGRHLYTAPPGAGHVGGLIKLKDHLDETLQTEYANLHVCDGSVIPENVKITPTLTLICLGKYLANRLAPASATTQFATTQFATTQQGGWARP